MRTDEAGFTLIETLVALIIFVACYLLIHQTVSLGWRGIQVAHTEAAALRIAQERLGLVGIETPLQEGLQTGQSDGYDWSVQVRRRAQQDVEVAAARLAGYWVTVEVHWREGPLRTARTFQLTTLKLSAVR